MGVREPELDVAVEALVAAGARFVVIGDFSLIANRYMQATEGIDFLVPDDEANDRRVVAALRQLNAVRLRDDKPIGDEDLVDRTHLRVRSDAGVIDVMRGGLAPLDFATVEERAMPADYGEAEFLVAGLSSIVGFKRLADRPRDRNDLLGLAEIHGKLPEDPIPGLDT